MSEKNTNRNRRFVTAEAVRAGHPDKFCDQLADRLLDEHASEADPDTRAAIEVMAAGGKVLVAGEVTSRGQRGRGARTEAAVRGGGLHHGRAVHGRQPVARRAA